MNENINSLYSITVGRNIYTILLSDIKKITLLQHDYIEKKDDIEEIIKSDYIFTIIGKSYIDDNGIKIEETLIELKANESDYSQIYKMYSDIIKKWDSYLNAINK